uniref:Cytochrome c biogenesis FN n=1 Tax=Podocarpus macrophyllus TaxID=58043 RepID=A0A6M3X3I9_9CONI|nr:cytochrome c maturation subunit FN [Podocarpus macrophyllus]QXE44202.1 cytochrome c biogenesis FN [Podocarpus macrophyllus]
MSINELCHYLLLPGLSVAFTYDRKQPPALGASPYSPCTLLSLPGPLFRHTPSNFPNYNVFTNPNANAPLPHQIPGTRSNHEGSIPPWCRIPSFYGFPFRYRVQPHISERGRETAFCSFASSLMKNSILFIPEQRKSGAKEADFEQALCAVPRTLAPPYITNCPVYHNGPGFASGGARRNYSDHGSRALSARGGEKTFLLLHLARDAKEKAEQRIYGAVGIALPLPLFLLASSNPSVRNSFVCTESLAESNPVSQDPILAIHPPRIYAGDVASATGSSLCISRMMNGIVVLYSPMRGEKNRTLCSAGRAPLSLIAPLYHNSRGEPGIPNIRALPLNGKVERTALLRYIERSANRGKNSCFAPLSHSNGSLLLRRRFFALSTLWPGVLMGEQAKRIVRNGGRDTTTISPLCRTAGANTGVSAPKKDREQIRIWTLTCRLFFTVGILLGSRWAYHELGRGGRWFRDPVENASFMPRVSATACIHPVILPKAHFWTLFPNIVTLLRRVSGTFLVRSGLLAPVHSPAMDSTRGIFLWRFFLLITGISLILFFQISGHGSIERTLFSKPLVHLRKHL